MQARAPQLGDTPPEAFRKQLHQMADWIADFRENLGTLRVAPNDKPGAIRAALPARPPEAAEPFDEILSDIDRLILPVFRIYTSDQAHSSVEKAAIALGLGEENVQRVPTDAKFRIDVAALRVMIERDLAQKFKPLAVVATVGTTSTASVDPVADIARICREHKI